MTFGTPSEIAIVTDLALKVQTASSPSHVLALADEALRKLPNQTKARGLVQLARAEVFHRTRGALEAQAVVEEAVRLLPDDSKPLMLAAYIFTYSEQPERAVDYYLRAGLIDQEQLRSIESYDVEALFRRLRFKDLGKAKIARLSARLIEVGWSGNDFSTRSSMVQRLISYRLENEDESGARALVSELVNPADMYWLLGRKEAAPVWKDIEAWGGAQLEKQWPIYLKELQDRWRVDPAGHNTVDYLGALRSAKYFVTISQSIQPVLATKLSVSEMAQLLRFLSTISDAYSRSESTALIGPLFEKFAKSFPLEESANALNVPIGHAQYLLSTGRTGEALAKINLALAASSEWGAEVNGDAIAGMHRIRVCALAEEGRAAEAEALQRFVIERGVREAYNAATVHLCLGHIDDAEKALIDFANYPDRSANVLGMLREAGRPDLVTPYTSRQAAFWRLLAKRPEFSAAASKTDRLLPFRLPDGAPPEAALRKAQ